MCLRRAEDRMDDRPNTPDPNPFEENVDPQSLLKPQPLPESITVGPQHEEAAMDVPRVVAPNQDADARRRSFRHHLFLLLSLALAAFVLTSWILVRVDAPFGILSGGPQEVVRAQLRALDRGELRPAYEMFSPRYRGQVSYETWHELFIQHWRMFHADVVRAETTSGLGPGVTMEIYLHGSDDKDYRALFTLIRADGRWWIDDVHWAEEADERDVTRI